MARRRQANNDGGGFENIGERIDDFVEDLEDDPFQAVIDRVLDSPQAQSIFERVHGLFDQVGTTVDRIGQRPRMPPPSAQPPPPPPPSTPTREELLLKAREVMHFGEKEQLSEALIRKRRRALAGYCHPDKGGSPAAMQRINKAAEFLIESLK